MAPEFVLGAILVFVPSKQRVAGRQGQGLCSRQRQTGLAGAHRTPWESRMGTPRIFSLVACAFLASWSGARGYSQSARDTAAGQEQPPQGKQAGNKDAQVGVPVLPRGKKLVLKDGTFQLARDYQRNGERVRYLSAERGDWEEIPAAMVDWDATAKAAAAEKAEEDALAKKLHAQEQAQRIEKAMEQVGSQLKTDKKQFLKQVLSPIPIVPSKRNVEILGNRASIRVTSGQAEFYLREAPPDPDRTTPIVKSSRPGESGPEVELVRATVKGNRRQLESIRSLFGEQLEEKRNSISVQRWEIAPTVFRFTVSEPLPPGEYALAEILPDGMNLYVWDFGVDSATGTKPTTPLKKKN